MVSIVFLGDSITNHGDWEGWFPGVEVHNLGVSGDTSADVLERLGEVVALNPQMVSLLIGTNDFGNHGRSVEHVVRNTELLLANLRRELPDAAILVHSILPRGREFADRVRDANRHLRQFAPAVGAEYLDLWPAFALEDGEVDPRFSDDRLHLTEAGYAAWLEVLRPALDRLQSGH